MSLRAAKPKEVLEAIANTPMVRLSKVPAAEGLKANILVKLEYFNPTGSLKDRIYREMILSAIKKRELKPGMEILEASTGNAGIACSFVGTLLGYRVNVVMPEGMSEERKKIMRAYGANIIHTPGGESDVDLCLEKIVEMKSKEPGRYWEPAQFSNPANITAHYKTTGPEIWKQSAGKIDCFEASQGTGGTISGVARFLTIKSKKTKFYAVEPTEAPLLSKGIWGSHRIEGIGDGFVPRNLHLRYLTGIVTTSSDEAIETAKRLASEEGIFCGISSGCNVAAAIKIAKRHPELRNIVTMINDNGERYFSTELCGEKKVLEIPEREHPMDEYTKSQLEQYQPKWEILQ